MEASLSGAPGAPNFPPRAVFLSYASQDAEAARHLCEALRGAGIEVWFDQEGGLEHGDEWDAKIRRQIKECVLFIPIISAATQGRHEGYFRLEWELAAERAMSIASGVPFILPVVIDDTREEDALVPDRFRKVQWTRLAGGVVPTEVQARFLRLWSHRTGAGSHEGVRNAPARELPADPGRKRGLRVSVLAGAAVAIVGLVAGWWISHRIPPGASPLPAPAATGENTEASGLVARARSFIYDPDSARSEFALADSLLRRATDIDPGSADAWAASALCNFMTYWRAYDLDRQRLVQSEADGKKALHLNPQALDALLALGLVRQTANQRQAAQEFLDKAQAIDPKNPRVLIALAYQIEDQVERAQYLERGAGKVEHPAEIYYYEGYELEYANRMNEAQRVFDRSIAASPFWRAYVARASVECWLTADPARIDAWLDHVPELKRDEPRVAYLRFRAALLRRDGAGAERSLAAVANDYFEDNFFVGPKSYLLAQAIQFEGRAGAAREQWQLAEHVLREKLTAAPADLHLRAMLAVTVIAQDRAVEGKGIADACGKDDRLAGPRQVQQVGGGEAARETHMTQIELAYAFSLLGDGNSAVAMLKATFRDPSAFGFQSVATLRAEPRWDSLRSNPGFQALLTASADSQRPQ